MTLPQLLSAEIVTQGELRLLFDSPVTWAKTYNLRLNIKNGEDAEGHPIWNDLPIHTDERPMEDQNDMLIFAFDDDIELTPHDRITLELGAGVAEGSSGQNEKDGCLREVAMHLPGVVK